MNSFTVAGPVIWNSLPAALWYVTLHPWRSLHIWRLTCSADRQHVWGPFMTRSTNLLIIIMISFHSYATVPIDDIPNRLWSTANMTPNLQLPSQLQSTVSASWLLLTSILLRVGDQVDMGGWLHIKMFYPRMNSPIWALMRLDVHTDATI